MTDAHVPTSLLVALGVATVAVLAVAVIAAALSADHWRDYRRLARARKGNRYLQARADRDRLLVVRACVVAGPERGDIHPPVYALRQAEPRQLDTDDTSSLADDLHSSLSRRGTV
jgi:hypothetical protein